jgi:hypothetical protein
VAREPRRLASHLRAELSLYPQLVKWASRAEQPPSRTEPSRAARLVSNPISSAVPSSTFLSRDSSLSLSSPPSLLAARAAPWCSDCVRSELPGSPRPAVSQLLPAMATAPWIFQRTRHRLAELLPLPSSRPAPCALLPVSARRSLLPARALLRLDPAMELARNARHSAYLCSPLRQPCRRAGSLLALSCIAHPNPWSTGCPVVIFLVALWFSSLCLDVQAPYLSCPVLRRLGTLASLWPVSPSRDTGCELSLISPGYSD